MDDLGISAFDIRMAPQAKVKLALTSLILGAAVSLATYLLTTKISETTVEAASLLFEDFYENKDEV